MTMFIVYALRRQTVFKFWYKIFVSMFLKYSEFEFKTLFHLNDLCCKHLSFSARLITPTTAAATRFSG